MAPRAPRTPFVAPDGHPPMINGGPAYEALAIRMAAARAEEGPRPTADGTRLRGSMALDCARKVGFQALGVVPTIDLGTETLVTFAIGQSYHDEIQESLVAAYGAELEVMCSYRGAGIDLSGHADAVYERDGHIYAVEIKSMKQYAWTMAHEGNRYDHYGPGPKREHITQAGIYAMSPQIHATHLHMIYISKDTGNVAEWILSVDEPLIHWGEPTTVRLEVAAELARLHAIDRLLTDEQTLPARDIPGYGLVRGTPPHAGSKDSPWNCRYCGWRDICAGLPAEPVRITEGMKP